MEGGWYQIVARVARVGGEDGGGVLSLSVDPSFVVVGALFARRCWGLGKENIGRREDVEERGDEGFVRELTLSFFDLVLAVVTVSTLRLRVVVLERIQASRGNLRRRMMEGALDENKHTHGDRKRKKLSLAGSRSPTCRRVSSSTRLSDLDTVLTRADLRSDMAPPLPSSATRRLR